MTPTPADYARLALHNALTSVRDLREFAHDAADLPLGARNGCREAFYMNARLIAGFFVRKPDRQGRDWHARDFVPGWTAPEPLKGRLDRVWELASKEVAHLSRERTPETPDGASEDVSLDGLTAIEADCYRVFAAWLSEYRRQTATLEIWEGYLRGPETEGWVSEWITLPTQ